jgi:hypothetical protein
MLLCHCHDDGDRISVRVWCSHIGAPASRNHVRTCGQLPTMPASKRRGKTQKSADGILLTLDNRAPTRVRGPMVAWLDLQRKVLLKREIKLAGFPKLLHRIPEASTILAELVFSIDHAEQNHTQHLMSHPGQDRRSVKFMPEFLHMPVIEVVRNIPFIKGMMPISQDSRPFFRGVVRRGFVEAGKLLVDPQKLGSEF